MFSANIHGLRNRIVRIFLRTIRNERLPLVTYYGSLVGLCEMGQEVSWTQTWLTDCKSIVMNHIFRCNLDDRRISFSECQNNGRSNHQAC